MGDKYFTIQIDKDKALADYAALQKRHELQSGLAKTILPVLQRFDGKKITKRIETAIEEVLPHWNVCLDHSRVYSSITPSNIYLWKSRGSEGYSPDLDYQHGFSFYLKRTAEGKLNLEKTVDDYPFMINGSLRGYYETLQALAYNQEAKDKFGELVDQWNECASKLEALKKDARDCDTPYQYLFDWN